MRKKKKKCLDATGTILNIALQKNAWGTLYT